MSTPALSNRSVAALAIGASAGGVESLSTLLPALPAACRIPIFVVLHQPRERPSLLVQIFSHRCSLRLVEPVDKQPIEPGVVYFAPPDYHLLVDAGPQLALSSDEPVHYSRPSVDVLFESAADLYGPGLVGVVLSGANRDGAAGLRRIAAAGGLTLVQSPQSAVATAMPQAALEAVPQSAALGLQDLAAVLTTLLSEGEAKVPR